MSLTRNLPARRTSPPPVMPSLPATPAELFSSPEAGSLPLQLRDVLKALHRMERDPGAVPVPMTAQDRSYGLALVGWVRCALDKVHADIVHAPSIRSPEEVAALEALGAKIGFTDVVKPVRRRARK